MLMEIFQYEFMQKAFIVGILIAIIIPMVGTIIVLKRLSMMGDALSHSSLAGIAGGLLLGINPILGAIIASMIGALSIEYIRKKIPRYSEVAIVIVMSTGIGLAGILSSFENSGSNLDSFLFGSIVSISNFEIVLVILTSIVVILVFILLYKELFYLTFDEQSARLSKVPTKTVSFIFTILIALSISIAARSIGALIVSSLLVVPVICALQFSKSFLRTIIYSIFFALAFTLTGLFVSFYLNLKPGATIVIIGVLTFIIILVIKSITNKLRNSA